MKLGPVNVMDLRSSVLSFLRMAMALAESMIRGYVRRGWRSTGSMVVHSLQQFQKVDQFYVNSFHVGVFFAYAHVTCLSASLLPCLLECNSNVVLKLYSAIRTLTWKIPATSTT